MENIASHFITLDGICAKLQRSQKKHFSFLESEYLLREGGVAFSFLSLAIKPQRHTI